MGALTTAVAKVLQAPEREKGYGLVESFVRDYSSFA